MILLGRSNDIGHWWSSFFLLVKMHSFRYIKDQQVDDDPIKFQLNPTMFTLQSSHLIKTMHWCRISKKIFTSFSFSVWSRVVAMRFHMWLQGFPQDFYPCSNISLPKHVKLDHTNDVMKCMKFMLNIHNISWKWLNKYAKMMRKMNLTRLTINVSINLLIV